MLEKNRVRQEGGSKELIRASGGGTEKGPTGEHVPIKLSARVNRVQSVLVVPETDENRGQIIQGSHVENRGGEP